MKTRDVLLGFVTWSHVPARLEARRDREWSGNVQTSHFHNFLPPGIREASVWTGHCDDIPTAADAPTLDELLEKISALALDLLPDNHPDIAPESLFLQITALREAEPVAG